MTSCPARHKEVKCGACSQKPRAQRLAIREGLPIARSRQSELHVQIRWSALLRRLFVGDAVRQHSFDGFLNVSIRDDRSVRLGLFSQVKDT